MRGKVMLLSLLMGLLLVTPTASVATIPPPLPANRGDPWSSLAASRASTTTTSGADAESSDTRRVNAPYFDDDVIWAQTAIFWFGQNKQGVPGQNYVDVRAGYTAEALKVRASVVDYYLWYDAEADATSDLTQYDAVALYLDTAHDQASDPQSDDYRFLVGARHWQEIVHYMRQAQGTGSGWNTSWIPSVDWSAEAGMSWSCNPGPNSNECGIDYGWTAIFTIPWETIGLAGPPTDGKVWGLGVHLYDRDDDPPDGYVPPEHWPEFFAADAPSMWGQLVFDPPAYEPPAAVVEGTADIRRGLNGTVEDAWMGGGGTCGGGHEGGSETNHGDSGDLYTGSEIAVTHFPCFNKSYLRFSLDDVPLGKAIISATLTLHLFGNAGTPGEAQSSWVHLYTVTEPWEEMTIHWNNAPLPQENVAVTQVNPYSSPGDIKWPGDPYTWDATQAVAEAYAAGQPLSVVLYASDSEQHSSKYYVGSESTITNGRPTLTVAWGRAVAGLTKAPSSASGYQGETITYALSFLGSGSRLTLTDKLPSGVSAPGSFVLEGTSVMPTYDGGEHRWTWSDTLVSGQEVTIRYPVTITTGSRQALENQAVLSEGDVELSMATAVVIANPCVTYLPLTLKED